MFCLSHFNLTPLISALAEGLDSVIISPDLNMSEIELFLDINSVDLAGKVYTLDELRAISQRLKGILKIENGREDKLEFFSDRYYKLRPTVSAPTLEIDGIQMHRTKNVDPWEDSRRKAAHAVRKGDTILDTCGGLGYTAIWAVKLGAKKVISMEVNPSVLKIRNMSPYAKLLTDERIEAVNSSVLERIEFFPRNSFDSIIHDPPRFSLAGELYGNEFYRRMNRVLKLRGRLFHYTGDPFSKGRGRKFIAGVMARLKAAGFKVVNKPEDLGVFAVKVEDLERSGKVD